MKHYGLYQSMHCTLVLHVATQEIGTKVWGMKNHGTGKYSVFVETFLFNKWRELYFI